MTSGRQFGEEQFRTLIEQSTDAIQLVSPTGEVLYSSDSVRNVLGYNPEEILGVNVSPYLHPDDMPAFMKRWEKLLKKSGAHDTLEYRVKHKDGSWVWVEATVTNHLETPGIEAIVGNFRNITQRKATEAKLRESEEQYRLLSDHSPEAVAVHAEGKVLYVNNAAVRMIGARSTKDLVGKPIAQFVHPDYLPRVAERIRRILVEGKPTSLEHEKFIRVDKQVIDVEVISLPVNYQGKRAIQVVIRDVTEQRRAVEALRESEERLRFMAESLPQKVFTANPEGEVVYCNPQWSEYTGLPFEKLQGRGLMDVIHPDDAQESVEAWKQAIRTGENFTKEQRFRRHDGKYRWHISRARAMRDESGVIVRWFGSNTDIHHIRLAYKREHELEKKAMRLTTQRSQLMALNRAKDEFIAVASHQLRTPATAVKQFLGMLADGYAGELTPSQKRMVDNANISNNRQINIINELLEVARLDAGKVELNREAIDVVELVALVVDELRPLVQQRKHAMALARPKGGIVAQVDTAKVRMALENLVSNASKYSAEGQPIEVAVTATEREIAIAVTDHGVGIAKKDIPRLFKKFVRVDNELSTFVGGNGLGLYWAQKIAALHGGDIKVSSTLDQGSVFTMILPISADRSGRRK